MQHNLAATADNDNRPAEFDAAVVALIPRLLRRARKHEWNPAYHEDLVNEAIELGLRRWRSFRNEQSLFGWLDLKMREVQNQKGRSGRPTKVDLTDNLSTPERQTNIVYCRQILDIVDADEDGDMLLSRVDGRTFLEIATNHGISESYARKRIGVVREKLAKVAA